MEIIYDFFKIIFVLTVYCYMAYLLGYFWTLGAEKAKHLWK